MHKELHRCGLRRSLAPGQRIRRASLLSAAGKQRSGTKDTSQISEQPAKLWGRERSVASPKTRGPPESDPEPQESWGVFDLSRYNVAWDVPWGPGRTAGGIALWFGSFVGVGFILVPALYRAAGVSLFELSPEDKASFTLVCQLMETAVSLALIRTLTAGPIKDSGASHTQLGLFVYDIRNPFTKPYGWAFWALVGAAASPLVVGSMAALLEAVGYEAAVSGRGTVDGVAAMIDLDLPTYLSLLAVTGVLAPVLEETVFRGFLLTSLTRFMPSWAALLASSAAFGLAHLSLRDLPILTALGLLLGASYGRSRNLLTPIFIHGAWNSTVLTLLFWLTSQGVDVQRMLTELRGAS